MDRNDVKIGMPCTLDWRKMTPAEGGRFCGDCKKVVRDLSSMTEREARSLLKRANGGELCVRYIYDDQGRVFFGADAPRPDPALIPPTFLSRARRAAAAAAVVALPFATQACDAITDPLGITSSAQSEQQPLPPGYHENMGGMTNDQSHQIAESADASSLGDGGGGGPDAAAADAHDQDGGTNDDSDAGEPVN